MDIKADGTCSKTFCELVEPETRKQEGNHLLLARSALVSSTRVAELSEEIIHSNLSWKEIGEIKAAKFPKSITIRPMIKTSCQQQSVVEI